MWSKVVILPLGVFFDIVSAGLLRVILDLFPVRVYNFAVFRLVIRIVFYFFGELLAVFPLVLFQVASPRIL
ncbi:hypothetical protein SDC9_118321 [bioreactor metagenome]|uniref:Uncharacterized protein n=1 Tax=bioreactor metagenome TaxID=1076179 RepID=A0A645C2A9_9ZZZZ